MPEKTIEEKVFKLEIGFINLADITNKLYNIIKVCLDEIKEVKDIIEENIKKEKSKQSYFT